jgi:hypothetical protein
VHIVGTTQTQTTLIIDGKGGLHLEVHQVADLSAEGLSTGDTYHTHVVFNASGVQTLEIVKDEALCH